MNSVEDKVALVTGGGRGIGKASCELLAQAGAKVVVTDIDIASAEAAVKSIIESNGEAIAIQHDVSQEVDWKKAMAATLETFGQLDVLVNSAGIVIAKNLKDTSLEEWRRLMSINLDGAFLGTRSAIQTMKDNANMGSIINIASISGLVGQNVTASYSASKGGLRLLSKAAATECGKKRYNIRVNSICPGSIDTPLNQDFYETPEGKLLKSLIPLGRWGQATDVAKSVLFLASDDSSFITGIDLVIDGGMLAGGGGGMVIDLEE